MYIIHTKNYVTFNCLLLTIRLHQTALFDTDIRKMHVCTNIYNFLFNSAILY